MSPPSPSPTLLDRLRRFDPTVLPILVAAIVLVGAVVWLLGRPLPQPAPAQQARLAEEVGALRTELERRVASLEGTANRVAALEARPAPDLGPVREQAAAAAGRAEAAERRVAALEERLAETARQLAARPAVDPATLAPRSAVEELSTRLGGLAERLDAVARDAQARDSQNTARIEQIGRDAAARQAAMEQAQLAVIGRLGTVEQALAGRAQLLEAQAQRIAGLEQALAQRVAGLEQQIAARTTTLEQQAARITALEGAAQRLAALEGRSARMATVDALRTALEAGRPLGPHLAALQNPPEALTRFANSAPPTEAALRLSFEDAARAGREASEPAREGQGVLDAAVARLSGLVTVRRGEEVVWGDAAAAEIERARRALEAGDLQAALGHLGRLPPAAREAMRSWISQAEALVAARAALRQLAAG